MGPGGGNTHHWAAKRKSNLCRKDNIMGFSCAIFGSVLKPIPSKRLGRGPGGGEPQRQVPITAVR